MKSFNEIVGDIPPISLDTLQVNVGLRCNKVCTHCHVQAGPDREETMNERTMERVLELIDEIHPKLVDITGGAPELNPHIEEFIAKLSKKGSNLQLRTNLTALTDKLIDLFAEKKVKLVASLPCYEAAEVDSVRGDGTFMESIDALRRLNEKGYGKDLVLELVFNPESDFLPSPQTSLEETFHRRLWQDFGVEFTHLITITNMPVGRFKEDLAEKGKLDNYMKLLRDTYNTDTLDSLMCRTQICVNWDGYVYDCDFNLAQNLMMDSSIVNINDPEFEPIKLMSREIIIDDYCYGCTAGQGSSCGGALVGN
jgi:radical SAM/Cys-rich protein